MPTITLGTTTISYTVELRPRRQYAAIQVDREGRVKILVPPGYPAHRLEPLLQDKASWILKNIVSRPSEASLLRREFQSGEKFYFVGDPLTLQIVHRNTQSLSISRDGELIKVRPSRSSVMHDAEEIRSTLALWYLQQAYSILPPRVDHYGRLMGVRPIKLKISEYKSRWGYCRQDGLIAFNWRIVQAPLAIVDYVVVHELCHLSHPHHRATFWDAVERILPDYLEAKAWLRQHAMELSW